MAVWSGDLVVFKDSEGQDHVSTALPSGLAIPALKRYRSSGPYLPVRGPEDTKVGDAAVWILEKQKEGFTFEPVAEEDFSKHYSESSFWDKLTRFARQAGREVVEKALILYYVGIDPKTPAWAKAVIGGALGYFILPIDAVPDPIPGVGYADDWAVLLAAMAAIASCITQEHIDKAKVKTRNWFGDE